MLKAHLDCLLPSITNLVNESISTGIVPTKIKAALVTPLLKKPSLDKNVMENFRPVSNLSFISKLTERVVLKRLTDHIFCVSSGGSYIRKLLQVNGVY